MPREVTDDEGILWTCIQAFAGLGNDPEKRDAARVKAPATRFMWSAPRAGPRIPCA
jgi:hypothetical protein